MLNIITGIFSFFKSSSILTNPKLWLGLFFIITIWFGWYNYTKSEELSKEILKEREAKELIIKSYEETIPILEQKAILETKQKVKKEILDEKAKKINLKIKEKPKYETDYDDGCDRNVTTHF